MSTEVWLSRLENRDADGVEGLVAPQLRAKKLAFDRSASADGRVVRADLARVMGGDLTAESAPGVGGTFTVTLPAAATTDR